MPLSPRTKIVATVGPSTSSSAMIRELIEVGVSIFRLNFSHGSQAEHRQAYTFIRQHAEASGRTVGILQDLQGPKIRIGDVDDTAPVVLTDGDTFRICTASIMGTREMVSTSYAHLARDLDAGMPVLIDDGRIRLEVTSIELDTDSGDIVTTKVTHGGTINSNKGINLPGTHVSAPPLTAKDKDDLRFGVELGVDMIALSFVRSANDLALARQEIESAGGHQPLIAKIEKPQAIKALPSIIEAADGIMVARGDLGVEMSPEDVPLIQKRIIRLCNEVGRPVITATQMLESMIDSPQPTRAEASDVANAVLDGTDAIMLSGETAIGNYPLEAVRMMATIARAIEKDPQSRGELFRSLRGLDTEAQVTREPRAVAHAARTLADDLHATAVVVYTESGRTAQRLSQARPGAPIIAIANRPDTGRWLALWHGVFPLVLPLEQTIDALIARVDDDLCSRHLASPGDRLVIVGANPRRAGTPSVFLEIHTVGT